MKKTLFASMLAATLSLGLVSVPHLMDAQAATQVDVSDIARAFARQGIRITPAEAARIRPNVELALEEARMHGLGNSKVDFAAVEIASDLDLDTTQGSNTVRNITAAIGDLLKHPRPVTPPSHAWDDYFTKTISLINDSSFLSLLSARQFFPVKISWEDIGRDQNSAWGDRISDVGIWARRRENDPSSAQLTLSVRRDANFRDKVLMVPAEQIKIHLKQGNRTIERTLPQRLRELGLSSKHRDRNVIVSNQFAIVPVPARDMKDASRKGKPPRVAFNFSIFPYGSTNFVITDVIEGSSDAIVGPGAHQLLYSNVGGKKAPFTASRAEDRPDLLKLEAELKAQGMDVDVQRYYLIQIPLRRNVAGLRLSNMGTPPSMSQGYGGGVSNGLGSLGTTGAGVTAGSVSGGSGKGMATTKAKADKGPMAPPPSAVTSAPMAAMEAKESSNGPMKKMEVTADDAADARSAQAGLTKVAIGHGEAEGGYFTGSGYRGARAEEPIRVTVVYFVTPVGAVTRADMEQFTKAFEGWDKQAIWGGSFVTKETE